VIYLLRKCGNRPYGEQWGWIQPDGAVCILVGSIAAMLVIADDIMTG